MIKAVLFDVGGVLHELDRGMDEDLQQELGLTDDQLKEIWADQIPRIGKGQLDEPGFWSELQKNYAIRQVDPSERLLTRALVKNLQPNERVLAIVRQLSKAGFKTAVLSDTNALHAAVFESNGIYEPFEFRFLSHEIGIRKPDLLVYKHALDKLGVRPEEAIFTDDNPVNVAAAEELGIHGIVFKNTDQFVSELADLLPGIAIESK